MQPENRTSVIDVSESVFKDIYPQIIGLAGEELSIIKFPSGAFSRVRREEIGVGRFEITTKFNADIVQADLKGANMISLEFGGEGNVLQSNARYSKRYRLQNSYFDVIAAENDMLYIVQPAWDRHFVQWSIHAHTSGAEFVLDNAEYAFFYPPFDEFLPVIGLCYESRMLFTGIACLGATGFYREIQPASC